MSDPKLVQVPATRLQLLAKAIQNGQIECPLTAVRLQSHGMADLAVALGALLTLESDALLAVLTALIDEKAASQRPGIDLVWTGPDTKVSTSRDTQIVLRDLFNAAEHDIFVAGFSFDSGDRILKPLHTAVAERAVSVRICLNIERNETGLPEQKYVENAAEKFLKVNWPFGAPFPSLFYDPRTLPPKSVVSMHAKCVIVDERRAFVSSANFTDRGQTRNIEVGVQLDDEPLAKQLLGQWNALISEGLLRRIDWPPPA